MNGRRNFLVLAAILIVLGIISFALSPVLNGQPASVCAEPGAPSSGFVDSDKPDCNITDASYEKIADWESSPKPFRIAGLVLIVAGIVVGATGLVRFRGGRGNGTGTTEPDRMPGV